MKILFLFFLSLFLLVGCSQNNGVNFLNVTDSGDSLINDDRALIPIMSVGSDDSRNDSSIVFSWVHESEDITLTFYEKGTYSYIYDDSDYRYSEIGSYTITENSINATDPDGYSYTETFVVNNNQLILTDEYGYSQSFERI